MLTKEKITEGVVSLLEIYTKHYEGDVATARFSEFDMDSLDVVELVMAAESHFGINIDDDAMLSYTEVQEVINGVSEALTLREKK